MSVLSTSFLTLMRRDFTTFSFFTAWHNNTELIDSYFFTGTLFFTLSTKTFAGLNAGM